mmetsp:Transcript_8304/g.17575  ORF Transcript_8304/g.17575 Transcript_8304/m.17575 type:complete len:382 (-) Transcript_8304:211-1356(-)
MIGGLSLSREDNMNQSRSSFHIHLDQSHKTALSDISFLSGDHQDWNEDNNYVADSLLKRIGEFRKEASCHVDNKTIDPSEAGELNLGINSTDLKDPDHHVETIIELKLRVANQQALIDELCSKLSEAESEKKALRNELKLGTGSNLRITREEDYAMRLQAENQQLRARLNTLEHSMKTQTEECKRKIEYYKNENIKLVKEKKLWEGGKVGKVDVNEISSSQVHRFGLMKLILRQESGCSASDADKPKGCGGSDSIFVNDNLSSELKNGARPRERATRRASIADTFRRPRPLQKLQNVATCDESIIHGGSNLTRDDCVENRRIIQRPFQKIVQNNVSQGLERHTVSSDSEEDADGLLVGWGKKEEIEDVSSTRRTRRLSNYF